MKRRRVLSVIMMMVAVLIMSLNAQAAVKISKKSATLIKGQSLILKVTGTKEKVKWSTNKKKVATVTQKGVVKAKAKGTATISAKVGKKTYKCKVKVETPKISKTKATLNVGKKLTLKITGNTQKVKWNSNKKSVAVVTQKGVVTAKKAGSAVITATIAKKKYNCKITVKAQTSVPSKEQNLPVDTNTPSQEQNVPTTDPVVPATIAVSSVSITDSTIKLESGSTYTLIAKVSPDNATDKSITWNSNNTSVATVDASGVVTAISEGTATITATSVSDSSNYGVCVVSVYEDYQKLYDNAEESIQMAVYGLLSLKANLVNPDSLQVHNYYYGISTNFATPRPCVYIDYSAMNGLGGYNRKYYGSWKSNDGVNRTGASESTLTSLYPDGYTVLDRKLIEKIASGLNLA